MLKFIKSFFKKAKAEAPAAEYKVEAPVVESTPVVKTKKVATKKEPAAKKPRAPKKPTAA
jgi:hypothetical protein